MFLRKSISKYVSIFKTLAKRAFSKPVRRSKLLNIITLLITDSLYGSLEIEACVKEAYRPATPLFSGLGYPSGKLETKFAVTTMTVATSKLYLLSTYNSPSIRRANCGMFPATPNVKG
jgi:hypothetical protein